MNRELEQLVLSSDRLRATSYILQGQAVAMSRRLVKLLAESDRICHSLADEVIQDNEQSATATNGRVGSAPSLNNHS